MRGAESGAFTLPRSNMWPGAWFEEQFFSMKICPNLFFLSFPRDFVEESDHAQLSFETLWFLSTIRAPHIAWPYYSLSFFEHPTYPAADIVVLLIAPYETWVMIWGAICLHENLSKSFSSLFSSWLCWRVRKCAIILWNAMIFVHYLCTPHQFILLSRPNCDRKNTHY